MGLSSTVLPAVPTLPRPRYLLASRGPRLQHGLTVTEIVVNLAGYLL